ncbi:MAG: ABC transporter permease [Dehalococcoidia bacterium]|nr:ABC transporter permease [Dehalococcoidia bacterium]
MLPGMLTQPAPPRLDHAERPPLEFRLPMGARAILRRWRRVISTTLGVGIALAIVVAMLSLSAGSEDLFTSQYTGTTVTLYALQQGGVILPLLPGDSMGDIGNASVLLSQIRSGPETREAIGVRLTSLQRERARRPTGEQDTENWSTVAVAGDPTRIPGMTQLKAGRWFAAGNGYEIVVGPSLARNRGVAVGDTVILNGRRMQVVGVGTMKGVSYSANAFVYVDYRAARALTGASDTVNLLMIDTVDVARTAQRLREARAVDVYTPADVLRSLQPLLQSRVVVYNLFSAMALGVAAIVVGNVLSASVSERRVEFATMMAIGVPKRVVLLMVMGEALTVALVGWAIGSVLGVLMGVGMNYQFAPIADVDYVVTFSPLLFGQALVIAIVVGALAGFFPARRALGVQPADALREA